MIPATLVLEPQTMIAKKFNGNAMRVLRRGVVKCGVLTTSAAMILGGSAFAASVTSTGTINLAGVSGPTCSISVAPDANATSLPVAVDNASHTTTVGRITQNCNNSGGYTLDVTSANCSAGARLRDVPLTHELSYSVNSDNGSPTPDGSWDVTGLLAASCTGQIARTASAPVTNYLTDLAVVFTASTALYPGSYTDTLTITMTASY
jgi:hypothetical protein